mgnify:CR=1 FL=1
MMDSVAKARLARLLGGVWAAETCLAILLKADLAPETRSTGLLEGDSLAQNCLAKVVAPALAGWEAAS